MEQSQAGITTHNLQGVPKVTEPQTLVKISCQKML